jgi:hypothetical protein
VIFGDCGSEKCPTHTANWCLHELPRVSTLRHSPVTDDTPLPFDLPSVRHEKLTVNFAGGNQSSNGGLLLLRQAERKHGVCLRLAEAMPDRRDPDRIQHAMLEMVMSRVLAIACGHEDAIDLDRLRTTR